MKRKHSILILIMLVFSINANAQRNRSSSRSVAQPVVQVAPTQNTQNDVFLSSSEFKGFVPVSPRYYDKMLKIYDADSRNFVSLSTAELAADKKAVVRALPNESINTVLEKHTKDGIKYSNSFVTGESGSYLVVFDHIKFTTKQFVNENNYCEGLVNLGVGVRITAKITTFSPNVNVSSLFELGVAAREDKLRGQISINVFGMESSQITDLVPLPFYISEPSIQSVLQSLSVLKTKVYNEDTYLHPQILSVKLTSGDCAAIDLLDGAKAMQDENENITDNVNETTTPVEEVEVPNVDDGN